MNVSPGNIEPFKRSEYKAAGFARRIGAELDFARKLCDLRKEKSAEWRKLLHKAEKIVSDADGEIGGIPCAVSEAERVLSPIAKSAKEFTVYCVGHAHIDMNWKWSWQETVAVTRDTFSTVLKLMDEFPEFHFSQSQASTYSIVERYCPRLLPEIARRIRDGRWEVTASHWVECDKNLTGAEALCRHVLYTRKYMRKLFGLRPEDIEIDWAPDTFGHAITVPSYLVKGGIKYLYISRPGETGPERPSAFWWKGRDGTRILVRNDAGHGYNGIIDPDIADRLFHFTVETGLPFAMFVYGVGDHGGGPTRRDILTALEMNSWPLFPNVKFARASDFFKRLEMEGAETLPTVDYELNFEYTGCYSSQSLVKKCNRIAENRTVDAEIESAFAWTALAESYPARLFEESWHDIMLSHFHDILPGSCVHDSRTYAHGLFQKTMASVISAETSALRLLASNVDTSFAGKAAEKPGHDPRCSDAFGAGVGFFSDRYCISQAEQSSGIGFRPFLVFNPLPWKRKDIVEAVVWDNSLSANSSDLEKTNFSVEFPDGATIPAQMSGSGKFYGHRFVRVSFPIEVGGIGYRICRIRVGFPGGKPPFEVWQTGHVHHCWYTKVEKGRGVEGLENKLVRIEFDMRTGGIRYFRNKLSGTEMVGSDNPPPLLEYAVERAHAMTSWIMDHSGPPEHPKLVAVERIMKGPYKASIEMKYNIHESDFSVVCELRSDDPQLYVQIRGTWFQRGSALSGVPVLRLALPMDLENPCLRYEIPFGENGGDHANGEELPALQWAQIVGTRKGKRIGCLLVNDSKHGHSFDGKVFRLTLIRSTYSPDPLPEIGEHEINLGLLFPEQEMSAAEATRLGRNLNHPLRVAGTDVHSGKLPASASLLSVSPESIVLTALKKAEREDAIIIRLYNTGDSATQVDVEINRDIAGAIGNVEEVDLMERPLKGSKIQIGGASFAASVPAFGIASFKIRIRKTQRQIEKSICKTGGDYEDERS